MPELAIVGEGDNRYVFVLDGNVARRRQVRTGVRANGRIEIVAGLRPDARVVTEGGVKVAEGMEVRIAGQGGGRGGGQGRPGQGRPGG